MDRTSLFEYLKFLGLKNSESVDMAVVTQSHPESDSELLKPNLDTLTLIVRQHTLRIAYQNIDLYIGKQKADLSSPALMEKLVRQRKGGVCYETAELLCYALEALQFNVQTIAAFPIMNETFDSTEPSTHNILIVTLEDHHQYLVDVGFGYNTLPIPLRISLPKEVDQKECEQIISWQWEKYQLQVRTNYCQLNDWIKDKWIPLFRFDFPLKPITHTQTDANWTSLFTDQTRIYPIRDNYVMLARITNTGRIGFHYEPANPNFSAACYKAVVEFGKQQKFLYNEYSAFKEDIEKELGIQIPIKISKHESSNVPSTTSSVATKSSDCCTKSTASKDELF